MSGLRLGSVVKNVSTIIKSQRSNSAKAFTVAAVNESSNKVISNPYFIISKKVYSLLFYIPAITRKFY